MKVLFLGVIVGKTGRQAAARFLADFTGANGKPDLVIANADFAVDGAGLTKDSATELFSAGVDVITMGEHVWAQSELETFITKTERVLRPVNLPGSNPGRGILFFEPPGGEPVGIINLSGYTFIRRILPENPFPIIRGIVAGAREAAQVIVMDFFAVPSAEKAAMRHHLDGLASLIAGTGTLVQTSDETIGKTGTASITDVGMVGAYDSVVGLERESEIRRYTTSVKSFPRAAEGRARVDAILCDIDAQTGWARSIERISVIVEKPA
jgi:metallophosphoesterase (TIGR00282 family)